ncbi:alpha/beta hydrolase [Brevibacterium sp. UCMA 11754]|uniref:alpha/beta hydrolase n=1 Tax=Brevibacterium sp. UCMA 11754 TaxID=2749198 RepID=UPI001F3ED503|nr:alpha/beta fold hydrolase [Brevibacterium sp. UCMA 11754]
MTFNSDGETLVGTLFRPDGATGPLPTVVAGGGWCYVKEIVLPHVARIVEEQGVQFLGFDYRGFGESSGDRRQHIDPWEQISDYKNALSYVENRDDVNSEKLGAFGISYSGGHVLVLAATDPRVKSVVGVVPVVEGYDNMRRAHGEINFAKLEDFILDDRRERAKGNAGNFLPMSSPTPSTQLSTWPFPNIGEVFHRLKESGEAERHIHESTVESTELLLNYSVFPYLSRILDTKVMLIVAEGDNITMWDREIAAFNAVASPHKRLELLPAVSHMSLYSDRADTNVAAAAAANWFAQAFEPVASNLKDA